MTEETGLPDPIVYGVAGNASSYEQLASGATPGMPDYMRDALVLNRRRALGQDALTGLAPIVPSQGNSDYVERDWSPLGSIFRSLALLFLSICATVGVVVGFLYLGARADDAAVRADPLHGGVARELAAKLFPGEAMSSAAAYLTAAELAVPLDEHEVLRAINMLHDLKPVVRWDNLTNAQLRHVMAVSYACQVDPDCRVRAQSVLNGPSDQRMMNYAAHFLERNARQGTESASRDLCDLTLLTGNTRAIAVLAPDYCSLSLQANPKSAVAREHVVRLGDPWAFLWLRLLAWVDSL